MLLRSVHITDPDSPFHRKTVDVRVVAGQITEVGKSLEAAADETVFAREHARLSPGFVDIGAYLGDPGHEEREDIQSLIASARAGGYVAVAVLPNTSPVRQTVADMAYLNARSQTGEVDLLPLAALSHETKGSDLTEMMELNEAGAIAFTDGPGRSLAGSLLKRGLEYAKGFGGLVMDSPYDSDLAEDGQMHEGKHSVQLGLQGIPTICETIPLRRALSILTYTEGRLLLHLVSSAESLELIRAYGLSPERLIGCTVGAHHLSFTDEELSDFNPNFKVMPPLRSASDREALRRGVLDGTITAIVSHHRARHGEEKDLEFSYAAFGALGLETAFRQQLSWVDGEDDIDRVVAALTSGPRRLLGLEPVRIAVGMPASLTLFTTAGSARFTAGDLQGKTRNSPLIGRELPGRILATINHDRLWTSA
ncbi:dihydroorotase [Neolewinella xylanilytica]|uniref:Dihydroorotase n=1 Tax=Neolewinella xylanilytica TaxID=1514080 RepID=A0A2S6I440_9BACT|nr:dihydroorotase [Neolewinella xylanilytica]PPK85829.1 dihydroorotase [Neolewinella xylanilytica]